MSQPVPAPMKPVAALVRHAKFLRKADPRLSYYVLLWAAQKGLEIRSNGHNTAEVTGYLHPLLDDIETSRKTLGELPEDGQDYVLDKAFKAFLYADNLDRSGVRTKSTASAFRAAAHTFECLKQFSALPEEIATRQRYAVWRASHIMGKVARGEEPDPPPSAIAEEEEAEIVSSLPSVAAQSFPAAPSDPVGVPDVPLKFFETLKQDVQASQPPPQPQPSLTFPSVPDQTPPPPPSAFPSVPADPNNLLSFPAAPTQPPTLGQAPPSGGGSAPSSAPSSSDFLFDLPSVPAGPPPVSNEPPAAPLTPPIHMMPPSGGASKQPFVGDNDSSSDSDDSDDDYNPVRPAPRVVFGAQPPNHQPTLRDISKAQKHSRMVNSALNFDDVHTAVKELCICLKALTGTEYQIKE